ncbi:MAG: hypothetical protein KKA19_01080, partial [Candidatus Margulisbacteria bacterium]|nr:hypothetical protein [Candidatus Margulisiibacteriota bacterium]
NLGKKIMVGPGQEPSILSPKGRGDEDLKGLRGATVEDFREAALSNPEKLATVLKNWLAE